MTTSTDQFGGFPPPPLPPDSGSTPPGGGPTPPSGGLRPSRVLRRSRTDRVGAGVAGGLGEYFNVDPVLFRVLFATAAFFGGAGVLAYLVAWVAIPEQGTVNAPVDRFVGELRRRRVPVWVVALAAGLAFWGLAFSWWAPGHFFPVIVVVIVLVAVFGRRARRGYAPAPLPDGSAPGPGDTVNLTKQERSDDTDASQPAWVGETRSWVREARIASRQRRRRALPVRLATIGVLVVVLAILAAIDAGVGIAIPVYFWVTLGIVLGGLVAGLALRRTPWSVAALLVPTVAGLIAFGGTRAQLHDGIGQKDWAPTSADALKSTYRLAFGQGILDLTHLGAIASARTVDIRLAAGEVRVLVPPTLNATVEANVHFGNVSADGSDPSPTNGSDSRGVNVSRTILPGPAATGPPVTINVQVADGNIAVTHTH